MTLISNTRFDMGIPRDLEVSEGYLYIAEGHVEEAVPTGLRVIDVSDLAVPTEAALYVLSDVDTVDLVIDGDRAYVAAWSVAGYGGLYVLDVSSPADPNMYSSVIPNGAVAAVDISTQKAYVTVRRSSHG
jgi:hypothetical protein